MLTPREDIQDDRLREGDGWSSESALQNSIENQGFKRFRDPAKKGRNAESRLREQHDIAPTEPPRQPTGHRGDDCRRQYVERHHPGNLIRRRRQTALHLRQDDADDQNRHRVERRRPGDRDHDHPAPKRRHARAGTRCGGICRGHWPRTSSSSPAGRRSSTFPRSIVTTGVPSSLLSFSLQQVLAQQGGLPTFAFRLGVLSPLAQKESGLLRRRAAQARRGFPGGIWHDSQKVKFTK